MSGKRKVVYIALTVVLTAVFLLIGVLVFEKSYLRIWESCKDLGNSAKYYFCEIFGIEHSTNVTVGNNSNVIDEGGLLPDTPQEFGTKAGVYFRLLINGKNITAWMGLIGQKTVVTARFLVLAIPFFLLLGFAIKKLYGRRNTKHNHDTVPLRIFKGFSAVTYQPLKRFVIGYIEFLKTYEKIVTAWLILWAFHLNLATIVIEFIAYYLYFAVSYKLSTVYVQICKLVVDLQIVLKHFPWWSLGGVGWILFCRWREKLGTGLTLRTHLAGDVSNFVNNLIEGKIDRASEYVKKIKSAGFSMLVTRDLEKAKEYCKTRYAGQRTKRYGLIASSKKDSFMKKYGVDNGYAATSNVNIGKWFNTDARSGCSCCNLEKVVTEFGCQGLELDMPIVCWGPDMIWNGNSWNLYQKFQSADSDENIYRINSYRVLLTRGRDGFIIFVPNAHLLDGVYTLLIGLDMDEL